MGLDINNDGKVNQVMTGPLGVDVDNDGSVDVVITPEKLMAWALKRGTVVTPAGNRAKPQVPVPEMPVPQPIPVPTESSQTLHYPKVVRQVVAKPVLVREYVDRPIYRDTIEDTHIFLESSRQLKNVEVRTTQRKAEHRPDFPYHDPTPQKGCDFWGPFRPTTH